MYKSPTVLPKDSNEYFQLKVACQIAEELTEHMQFKVQDVYFDFGQDWMWTTIIAYNLKDGSSFQMLSPREWEEIINDATNSRIREIIIEGINEYPSIYNIKNKEEKK